MAVSGTTTLHPMVQPRGTAAKPGFDDLRKGDQVALVATSIVGTAFAALVGSGFGAIIGDIHFESLGTGAVVGALLGAAAGGLITAGTWQGQVESAQRFRNH